MDSDAGHTKKYIASLCFSRAWVHPIRRVLCRTITQSYNTPAKSPLLWNTLWTTPHLRKFVRRLHLMQLDEGQPVLLTEINAILPCCSVLLSLPGFGRLIPESVVSSNSIGNFAASSGSSGLYSKELWETAFSNWTRLESLQIEGNPLWFPYNDYIADDGAYLPSLRVLSLKALRDPFPIPPTTPNTLHSICLSYCLFQDIPQFITLIQRHSESLRRLYIGFSFGGWSEMLTELLPHTRRLETVIIQDQGEVFSGDTFRHLPPSLLKISLIMSAWVSTALSFDTFYTFILNETSKPRLWMIEIGLMGGAETWSRTDQRWVSFARSNVRQDLRIMFPKRGEDGDLPSWARWAVER
jgi:hypothetical protein